MKLRWDLFEAAERAAFLVCRDTDMARDAALRALEECGPDADKAHVLRRARDRAKDEVRRAQRAPTLHGRTDTLASPCSVPDEADAHLRFAKAKLAMGRAAGVADMVIAGHTDAEIGAALGYSQQWARVLRLRFLDLMGDGNEEADA